MATLSDTPILGLEIVQRQALFMLMDNVNPVLEEVNFFMQELDEELADKTGVPFVPTTVEEIAPQNFVEGHRPSLISAPLENYPNCAVWAVRAQPTPGSNDFDQLSVHSDVIYIEIMVKSIESEEMVNRRIHRTTEAVHIVMNQDRTLNGTVSGYLTDPVIDISDVFTRKGRTSYGQHWFWQGARLQYSVRKEAVYPPSSTGSSFRDRPQFSIDQE